ncbi:hypothetical protein GCM10020000_63960 [Streptomyces olivoverticillatus]
MKLSRCAASLSALLVTAALALGGAGTAQATPHLSTPGYVALGDSYSSGVGAEQLRLRKRKLQAQQPGLPQAVGGRALTLELRLHRVFGRAYG